MTLDVMTRPGEGDARDVVADAPPRRRPVVARSARTAVAWLYRGQALHRGGAVTGSAIVPEPTWSWLRRLLRGSFAG